MIRVLLLSLALCLGVGCAPTPVPVDGGPASTPTSWVSTAVEIDNVLAVALPAMAAVVPILGVPPQVAAILTRAISLAISTALPAFVEGLATYQREATACQGPDAGVCLQTATCNARGTVDGLAVALRGIDSAAAQAGFGAAPAVDLALSGTVGILDATALAGCVVSATTGAVLASFRAALPVGLRPWPSTAAVHQ